ncbi:MAG: DMT family transporter [Ilumatobacteraceae bacterium]
MTGGSAGPRRGILVIAASTTFLASVGVNLQIRANAQLAIDGVHPMRVALVNMGVQLAIILLLVIFFPRIRAAVVRLSKAIRARQVRLWWFVGGFVGASVITLMGIVSPLVGVAVFSIALVAGQTTSSLAVDRWGLGPGGRRALTRSRIFAAIVAIVAVVVSVSDRFIVEAGGELAWGAAGLALLGGLTISFQAAANGRLAVVSGQPAVGAGVNFGVGVAALSLVSLLIPATLGADRAEGFGTWWLYLGAIFGLLIVLNTAWAVRYLGILLLTVIGVSGQMAGALAMDLVLPTSGVSVTPALIAGILLAVVAVLIGSSAQWRQRSKGLPLAS